MLILPQKRGVTPTVFEALGVCHFNPVNLFDEVKYTRLNFVKNMGDG